MTEVVVFSLSSLIAYYTHHFCERFFSRAGEKDIRLTFRGYQIHHSFWGVIAIAVGAFFLSGVFMIVFLGYGIGNILQHKVTHNRMNEKGIVFISKVLGQQRGS